MAHDTTRPVTGPTMRPWAIVVTADRVQPGDTVDTHGTWANVTWIEPAPFGRRIFGNAADTVDGGIGMVPFTWERGDTIRVRVVAPDRATAERIGAAIAARSPLPFAPGSHVGPPIRVPLAAIAADGERPNE